MMNLPQEIIHCILSRLPVRSISACKCICKQFLGIISTPEFVKSHLSSSSPGLIVHQFEDQDCCRVFEFEDSLGLQRHDQHYNLVTQFDPRQFITSPEARITIEGSVNGLLLLRDFSTRQDSLYVCNPITRECVVLPKYEPIIHDQKDSLFGFGVNPENGEYKVVWNFHGFRSFGRIPDYKVCIVYTLGTGSWRAIEPCASIQCLRSSVGVLHRGRLHWLVQNHKGSHLILCFDLEKELFHPLCALPPYPILFPDSRSLVVLKECLCLCEYKDDVSILVWSMNEYGVAESWTQLFFIRLTFQTTYQTMYPIKVFKDGEMLILWEDYELFFHCKKTDTTQRVGMFEMVHYKGWTEAMLHTSSFVSLRTLCGENVTSF